MKPDPQGYILLHRKFTEDWKAQDPKRAWAWTWLLLNASWQDNGIIKRGQVKKSIRWLAEKWGMSKSSAHRFLKRCVTELDITMEIVCERPTGTIGGTIVGTIPGTIVGTIGRDALCLITILNYDKYQTGQPVKTKARGTIGGTIGGTPPECPGGTSYIKEEKEEEKKKKGDPPTQLPKKLQIEMIRSELGLYEKEFPYLDINLQFRKWKNWLENNKAPKKYKASFDNWLIGAEEYRIRDSKTQKTTPNAFRKEFGLD